jgi:hypothetical protein
MKKVNATGSSFGMIMTSKKNFCIEKMLKIEQIGKRSKIRTRVD